MLAHILHAATQKGVADLYLYQLTMHVHVHIKIFSLRSYIGMCV